MIPHDWCLFAGGPEQQHPFIILILSAGALQPDIRQLERTEKFLFLSYTPLSLYLRHSAMNMKNEEGKNVEAGRRVFCRRVSAV